MTQNLRPFRWHIFLWLGIGLVGVTVLLVLIGVWYQYSRSAWERNWLTGNPCHAPCWEGITPGQTTITETMQLLRQNTNVGQMDYYQSDTDAYNEIFWGRWKNDYGTGRVVYDRDTSIVSNIGLAFPHDFTLGEVIHVYGEPSQVLAMAARNLEKLDEIDYTLTLYWPLRGIIVEWAREYPPRRPVINSSLKFHSVGFFEPSAAGLEANPARLALLETWKGYIDFGEYCHVVDGGGGIDPTACEAK